MSTAALLRAVVDRDTGIRGAGVLSNLTLAEMPSSSAADQGHR
ncbi:MAG: hypothetical protein R3D53_14175 [Paracoccaceae bacterium]